MTDARSDLELLTAWRGGQDDAGKELYDRYSSGVIRFFLARVQCPETAQDLTQRSFLACVEGRDRIRKHSSFRAYLFGVAHNLMREHIRKRGRSVTDSGLVYAQDSGPSATSLISGSQEQRALLEALRRIPVEHQIAFELHYWERLSGSEIADVLGIPEGTVRTRLLKGKKLIASELARIESGGHGLCATLTTFDSWAAKLRAMLLRRN
jgi:RNA polymerase sigma-70 factor (ECF subfamily)